MELGPNDERFRSPETHFEWGDIQIQTSKAKLSTKIAEPGSESNNRSIIPTLDSTPLGCGGRIGTQTRPSLKTENTTLTKYTGDRGRSVTSDETREQHGV